MTLIGYIGVKFRHHTRAIQSTPILTVSPLGIQDIVVRATTANIIDVDSSTVDGEYGAGEDIYINVTFG